MKQGTRADSRYPWSVKYVREKFTVISTGASLPGVDTVQPGVHLDGLLRIGIDILAEREGGLCGCRGKRRGNDDGCVLDNPESDRRVFIIECCCIQVTGYLRSGTVRVMASSGSRSTG